MMSIPGIQIPEHDHKHVVSVWMYRFDGSIFGECAACGEVHYTRPSNYCPNCGALMLNVYDAWGRYDTKLAECHADGDKEGGANND